MAREDREMEKKERQLVENAAKKILNVLKSERKDQENKDALNEYMRDVSKKISKRAYKRSEELFGDFLKDEREKKKQQIKDQIKESENKLANLKKRLGGKK